MTSANYPETPPQPAPSSWLSAVAIVSLSGFCLGLANIPLLMAIATTFGVGAFAALAPVLIVPVGLIALVRTADTLFPGDQLPSAWARTRAAHSPNWWRAIGLGLAFATGVHLTMVSGRVFDDASVLWPFGVYVCFVAFFHWSEFFVVAVTNPAKARVDIYMLNHSPEYLAAAGLCFVEHWLGSLVRCRLAPGLAAPIALRLGGIGLCLAGEVLRKTAILTAAANFNHYVQTRKHADHNLVVHGVYAFCRHPSYVGWFYWSVGTQILMANPICAIIYPLAAQRFFSERIQVEEEALVDFFGDEYRDYQVRVGTGLPFVRGYETR